jgi:hypothetical protein
MRRRPNTCEVKKYVHLLLFTTSVSSATLILHKIHCFKHKIICKIEDLMANIRV